MAKLTDSDREKIAKLYREGLLVGDGFHTETESSQGGQQFPVVVMPVVLDREGEAGPA